MQADSSLRRWGAWLVAALLAGLAYSVSWGLASPGLLGLAVDDGMYALYAKALATGQGYVDLTTPFLGPATRYPIGYPALLAVWMVGASDTVEMLARLQWVPPLTAAAFLAVACWTLRRHGMGLAGLAAAGLLILLNPTFHKLGTLLVSDLAFGIALLVALAAAERAWRSDDGWRTGFLAGALAGLTCLVRYYGATLLVVALPALLLARRWRAAAGMALGTALTFGPWGVYRLAVGGETYTAEIGTEVAKALANPGGAFAHASRQLVGTSVPEALFPAAFGQPSVASALVGLCGLALLLVGAIRWLRDPGPGGTPLGPALWLLTAAIALAMECFYQAYAGSLISRYMAPVLPLTWIAVSRGLEPLLAVRPRAAAWGTAAVAAIAIGLAGTSLVTRIQGQQALVATTHRFEDYARVYAFLREKTPPGALLLGWNSHALSFQTNRPSIGVPVHFEGTRLAASVPAVVSFLRDYPVRYVVGTPYVLKGSTVDNSVELLNTLMRQHPGWLRPVYVNATAQFVVFEVAREAGVGP